MTVINNGVRHVSSGSVTGPIVGHGEWDLVANGPFWSVFDVIGFVSPGQTFNLTAGTWLEIGDPSIERAGLDKPSPFHGKIDFAAPDRVGVEFVGILNMQADSYELRRGFLELFDGDRMVDALRVSVAGRPLTDGMPLVVGCGLGCVTIEFGLIQPAGYAAQAPDPMGVRVGERLG